MSKRKPPLPAAIRRLRLERELSQTEMAKQLGISRQAYAGYEKGTLGLSTARVADIARVLGVATSELLRLAEGTPLPPSRVSETRQVSSDYLPAPGRSRLPVKAYARVTGYVDRMVKAGLPDDFIDAAERLLTDSTYSTIHVRDVRERSVEETIMDIDATWEMVREVVRRERGVKL